MREYNNGVNEFGANVIEQKSVQEKPVLAQENFTFSSNPTFGEHGDVDSKIKAKPKNAQKLSKTLTTLLTATAATVTLGVSVVPSITETFAPAQTAQVIQMEVYADCYNNVGGVGYYVELNTKAPLEVIIYNDFVTLREDLRVYEGMAEGSFENLKVGATYTFAIVGDGMFGEKQIASQKITIPQPIDNSTARFIEYGMTGDGSIYYAVESVSEVPIDIVLYCGQQELSRVPFDLTYGGTVDGAVEGESPYTGNYSGSFENVTQGEKYTITVEGKDILGKTRILTRQDIESETTP